MSRIVSRVVEVAGPGSLTGDIPHTLVLEVSGSGSAVGWNCCLGMTSQASVVHVAVLGRVELVSLHVASTL